MQIKNASKPLDENLKESGGKFAVVFLRYSTLWCRRNVMWLDFNRNFLSCIHFKLGERQTDCRIVHLIAFVNCKLTFRAQKKRAQRKTFYTLEKESRVITWLMLKCRFSLSAKVTPCYRGCVLSGAACFPRNLRMAAIIAMYHLSTFANIWNDPHMSRSQNREDLWESSLRWHSYEEKEMAVFS